MVLVFGEGGYLIPNNKKRGRRYDRPPEEDNKLRLIKGESVADISNIQESVKAKRSTHHQ